MKILIAGDSFAADWSVKYPVVGWPNLLAQDFEVTNLAQAGCSEYKIKKQIDSVNLDNFTHAVIVHTSPSRIPVEQHPLYGKDSLYHACDFIYADVAQKTNSAVQCVKDYYENFYYDDFFLYVYSLIIQDIDKKFLNSNTKIKHLTFFETDIAVDHTNYHYLFQNCRGDANHLNQTANQQVYKDIKQWIQC